MRKFVTNLSVGMFFFASGGTANAATISCAFGDSHGVAFHGGGWKSGTKAGSIGIVYRTESSSAHATREAGGDPKLDGILIQAGFGLQIVTTWGPAPGMAVEVTTIAGSGIRRPAVRSLQVLALANVPSVMLDHGYCEVTP